MGSISFSQKCARRASDGSWNWGSMSGADYVDNNSYNYYCVVYKASVSYDSGQYLQSVTAGVRIYAGGSTLSLNDSVVRATLYTSDPTGGSSLPSGIASDSVETDLTSSGQVYSFTFSGLSITSGTVYVGFTVDKDSAYASSAHAVADAGTASISGSWYTPPTPTYCTLILEAGTGIATVTGGGTQTVPGIFTRTCTLEDGYAFDGWYLNGSKVLSDISGTVTITVAGTFTLVAQATYVGYQVTVTAKDYVDSVSGAGWYDVGDEVSVSATLQQPTATEEYVFDRWVDASTSQVVSYDNPYTFTIQGAVSLEAYGKSQSRGAVRIHNGTAFVKAIPYIYNGSAWQRALPYVHDGTDWKTSS